MWSTARSQFGRSMISARYAAPAIRSSYVTPQSARVLASVGATRHYAADASTSAPNAGSSGTMVFLAAAAAALGGGYYVYNNSQETTAKVDEKTAKKALPSAKPAKKLDDDAPSALNPQEFVKLKLDKTIEVTHDSKIYRFSLPTAEHKLGLPVASCLVLRAAGLDDGKDLTRPYTPISSDKDTRGYVDLLVKVYPDGKMSQHIDHLKPGDSLEFKGPIPKWNYKPNIKKHVGMIAGGTGITPMYQVLRAIVDNPEDETEVSLIFCNKSEDDILMKPVLDELAKKHSNFKVHYVVDKAKSSSFKGDQGYINKDIIKKHIAGPSDDAHVLVCGPPGFYKIISGTKTPDYKQGELTGFLKDLGYTEAQVLKL